MTAEKVRIRELTTPEGIVLDVRVAPLPERFSALAFDLFLMILSIAVLALLLALATAAFRAGDVAASFVILAFFFLRNFYFAWFELRRNGSTPGKRRFGLRVVDVNGGPLRAEAVLARNFLRELELFLPLMMVLAPEHLWPGASGVVRLAAVAWTLVFAFLPFFDVYRRRAGDFAAGTLVIVAPSSALLADLAAPTKSAGAVERLAFTREELEHYGVYELQVLEDLLRRSERMRSKELEIVCAKIKKKIGRAVDGPDPDPRRFLRDFYAAQRAVLERKMLLGRRKEDQHDA